MQARQMQSIPRNVSSLMTPSPVVIDWRASLEDAFLVLQRFPFRHLPVVEGDSLVGIVSDQDLLATAQVLEREAARAKRDLGEFIASCPVGDVIRGPRLSVSPADSQARVVRLMLDHGVDALPVTRESRLVGIVTSTDLIDSFVELCLEHGVSCDAQVVRYMRRDVSNFALDTLVREALEGIDSDLGYGLVLADGEVIGVVSIRELRIGSMREIVPVRNEAGEAASSPRQLRICDVITNTVRAIEPGARMSRAALKMVAEEIGALPISRMGRPLGLISRTEILRHYVSCL